METKDNQQGTIGQDTPIAVIGYGVRFPGDATSPEAFYEMLSKGRSAWSETPENRYNVDAYWHPDTDRIGTTINRGAHYVTQDPAVFDAPFFSMTTQEATALDPALRMMLEVVYECLEDSGIPMQSVVGSDTSVFVGTSSSEYKELSLSDIENVPLYSAVGVGVCMLANRLSHFYDLRGTSITMDTACSATMVAMHQACNSLRTGESRMSLVGGAQLMLGAGGNVSLTRLGFLSADSRCYTFDDRANGYARGEGVGVMALKRLDDALADGDTIRAVVRATGSNQDGRTPGIVQPNSEAQSALIRQVYSATGLDPDETECFEAHGTGTTLGDPLEVNALVESLGTKDRSADNPLYISSVKTNIGHLEGVAGLAGLFKAILQLEHGQIFPSLNFENPNPRLRLDEWNLRVPTKTIPWPTLGQRRISVNSFGYGGTNGHCILDDAHHYLKSRGLKGMTSTVEIPPGFVHSDSHPDSALGSEVATPENERAEQPARLFVFSAPEQAAVDRITTRYAEHLQQTSELQGKQEPLNLSDLAFTLGVRRSAFQWRVAVVAKSQEELQQNLSTTIKASRSGRVPSLLWVFTGQGAQHAAMGKELMQYEVFEQSVQAARTYFRDTLKVEWDVIEELSRPGKESNINQAEFSQPLCTVVQVALVDLLHAWKIAPRAVVGHSSGEIGAAYAAGALSAEDAWKVAYHRGRLSAGITTITPELQGCMGMMSVGLSADQVQEHITGPGAEKPVVVACYNSPSNVTLSGHREQLAKLEEKFKADNVFARALQVEVAYHSPYMKNIADQYLDAIKDIKPLAGNKAVTMLSTVEGKQISPEEMGAEYWVKNMCSPVRFVEAVQAAFASQKGKTRRQKREGLNIDGMLEVGPHSALQGPLKQILTQEKKADDVHYASMLQRGKDAVVTSLEAAGALWARGLDVDLHHVNNAVIDVPQGKVLSSLPTYPWNHSHSFWFEHKPESRRKRAGYRHDLVGARLEPHTGLCWRNWWRPTENPWLEHFKMDEDIVISPQTMLVSVIEAGIQMAAEAEGKTCHGFTLSDVHFDNSFVLPAAGTDVYTTLRALRPEDGATEASVYEFDFFTDDSDKPIMHCTGLLRIHFERGASLPELRQSKDAEMSQKEVEAFYKQWAGRKVHWGEQNKLLTSVESSPGSSVVSLALKNTAAAMPLEYEHEHLVHPTTLNACFQAMYAALGDESDWRETRSIDSIYVSTAFPQGEGVCLTARSNVAYRAFGASLGELDVQDAAGTLVVRAQGVKLEKSKADLMKNTAIEQAPADVKKVSSNLYWKPDVAMITSKTLNTVFGDELLLRSSEKPVFEGTGSLCHHQRSAVPDMVPWKAFTAKWLELVGHKDPKQMIVEVTKTTSEFATKALDVLGGKFGATPVCSKYLCATTDAVPEEVTAHFQPWAHFFQAKQLDLSHDEKETVEIDASTVDTFVVSHLLESIESDDVLLKNAANALKPGGRLILSQVANVVSEEKVQQISQQLRSHGLGDVRFSLHSHPSDPHTRLLVAQKPNAVPQLSATKAVFVLPEQQDISEDLQSYMASVQDGLAKAGVEVVERMSISQVPSKLDTLKETPIVSFLEAEKPFVYAMDEAKYTAVKSLMLSGSAHGIWVRRGNCYLNGDDDPAFHATTGLLRVMRNEVDNNYTELALTTHKPLARPEAIEHLLASFHDIFEADSLDAIAETEFTEVAGVLWVPRIYDEPVKNRKLAMAGKQAPAEILPLLQQDYPRRLQLDDNDDLNTLKFVLDTEYSDHLAGSQVEIDVKAHGVRSIRDMEALGLFEDTLGLSAAGTVAAVGSKVSRFSVGDEVAFFAPGAYRTKAQVHEDAIMHVPSSIPTPNAASLSSNLLLAYYALVQVCRLRENDSVLVTSAESGLGHLVIQLAVHLKADVFVLATEGSTEMIAQRYGIPSARVFSPSSYLDQQIEHTTGGQGVDFIFNVSRDAASEIALRTTSKLGKVFEYGRTDPSVQDIQAIEELLIEDEALVQHLTSQAEEFVKQGIVKPLDPEVCGYSDMQSVFESVSQIKGETNMALELRSTDQVPVVPVDTRILKCRPDATYVLVGGLGGVGRWLAHKLASHGAKYIATLSRSGAKKQEAQDCLQELADLGVDARAYCCDIGDADAFQSTLEQMKGEMPPVKGAIHGAMVIWDLYLSDMGFDSWNSVSENKIKGGYNMHNYLPKDMDFLVFISSLSPIMGQATQANYSAGNAFLDGLAHHRRSQGYNASVVNFGLIAGIGFVANLNTFDEDDGDFDKYSIPPHEVWSVLQSAMTGYIDNDVPMGTQLLTCCLSGGLLASLRKLTTFPHLADPKWKFIAHLDSGGAEDSATKLRKSLKQFGMALGAAESFNAALDIVEAALIDKVAGAIPMPSEDVDPARPLTTYGVDSLIASEIRNWAYNVVKGVLSAAEILGATSINELGTKLTQRSELVPEQLKEGGS